MANKVMHRYNGFALGHEVGLQTAVRQSTEQVGPDDILWWGNQKLTLNTRHMQPRLTRLIPSGYLTPNVQAKDWEPFIRQAVLHGLFQPVIG